MDSLLKDFGVVALTFACAAAAMLVLMVVLIWAMAADVEPRVFLKCVLAPWITVVVVCFLAVMGWVIVRAYLRRPDQK